MLSRIVRANMHGVLTQHVHFVPKLVRCCTFIGGFTLGPKTFVSTYQNSS